MKEQDLIAELESGLREIPLLDIHTHLDAEHLAARGLHDVLLYHMVISDLYGAGCPSGARLSWNPSDEEAHQRLTEALPFVPYIRNTSCYWGVRIILADLYGWTEPLTEANWQEADAAIRARSADAGWSREILRRAGIRRAGTEWRLRAAGQGDDVLQYAMEWAFFARAQWGVPEAPLYELEATWGQDTPRSPLPIEAGQKPPVARLLRTAADVREAMSHYCDLIPFDQVYGTAQHISTDIDFRPVSDAEMDAALARREQATQEEQSLFASYLLDAFLAELQRRDTGLVFQFSLGAEPLPFETGSRLSQRTIGQLAEIIARFPRVPFQCFLSSRHANQSLCTLARELPNFSLAGFWWHNFFPSVMQQIMDERLDMLPTNKQVGFFSDAYCVDWAYAKAVLVRRQLARVLARRVRDGQYTVDDALAIARAILWESPGTLCRMRPS